MTKSTQTKVKEISEDTKRRVMDRQHGRSISGAALTSSVEFHHCVFRSAGGVGYEWNIVALTPYEHRCIHDRQPIKVYGRNRYSYDEFITLIKNHLKICYPEWSEDKCRYHKGWEEEDYEIARYDQR